MSVNNTSCSPSGTCAIITTGITNGTFYVAQYNPNAPVIRWQQTMELATICVCNSLTLILIFTRLWYRWTRLNRFRGDDRWMAIAGFFMIGYFVSQIGSNIYGSGLRFVNIPEYWREMHWQFSHGYAGYYIVTTCIKLSVCYCFLEILGPLKQSLTYLVQGLCVFIAALGTTEAAAWLFGCSPFLSNFVWTINSEYCVNYDIFRYLFISLSIIIDIVLMFVPFQILKLARLREYEQRILKMVFCATLLGTITCAIGIYGAYQTRTVNGNEAFYMETSFVMMNDIEILMYALGATFPVFSRFLIQRASIGAGDAEHRNFSSWARYVPDFFLTNSPRNEGGTVQHSQNRQSYDRNDPYKGFPESVIGIAVTSDKSGSSFCDHDFEKEASSSGKTGKSARTTDESVLMEYIQTTRSI